MPERTTVDRYTAAYEIVMQQIREAHKNNQHEKADQLISVASDLAEQIAKKRDKNTSGISFNLDINSNQ